MPELKEEEAIDPAAMGYEAWMRGQCKYECAICSRRFDDR